MEHHIYEQFQTINADVEPPHILFIIFLDRLTLTFAFAFAFVFKHVNHKLCVVLMLPKSLMHVDQREQGIISSNAI